MPIIPYKDQHPVIDANAFVAPDAWVTGDTSIASDVTILFGASLRGDIQPIRIGKGTNIQEHAILHTSHGLPACEVGEFVTIGHQAIIHGCSIGSNCIIGMGSVILDGAVIEDNCIIGAQALVPMNTTIPAGSLVLGVPAKVVRQLTEADFTKIRESAEHYIEVGKEYSKQLNQ